MADKISSATDEGSERDSNPPGLESQARHTPRGGARQADREVG
jgi:hypothetical protein